MSKLYRANLALAFAIIFTVQVVIVPNSYAEGKSDQSPAEIKQDANADDENSAEEKEQLAGHSYHGETFNEGPRQKAYLMGGTGNIHFPVTTKNEQVQKFIDQGIGQLHGFWYLEAERSFRHAAMLDPDCAMAFWGAAFANLRNKERSEGFIEEAIKRKDKASDREKLYLDALEKYIKADKAKKDARNEAYTKALEKIILEHPEDLEAKAFLALHLYGSRNGSTSYFAVNALMEEILAENPAHPVHHFRIHLWDYKKPEKALSSANQCGQAAPNIAHMWHMPGHIFSRLKRYQDAAWQQEASARVDHAQMMRDRLMPDQIHNFAHNNEWLIRNLLYVGRVHDALLLAKNMTELPRHPTYNTLEKRGSSRYGRQRLFQTLESYQLWEEVISLADTPYLEPTEKEEEQTKRLRLLAMAHLYQGNQKQVEEVKEQLDKKHDALKAQQEKDIAEAKKQFEKVLADKKAEAEKKQENKNEKNEVEKEESESEKKVESQQAEAKQAEEIEKQEKTKTEDEKTKLTKQQQKDLDKKVAEAKKKTETKIKNLTKILDEINGRELHNKKEYKAAYEKLKKSATSSRLFLMQAQWDAGESEKADKAFQDYIKSHKNEVLPQTMYIQQLLKVDQKEKAIVQLKQLAEIASAVDLDIPLFQEINQLAQEAGMPSDWRSKSGLELDLSTRPQLDDLGPFRWQPSQASSWQLVNETGNKISSTEYAGKPHVLIFYLGFECLHCVDQLHEFAPKAEQFKKAGFDLVAISTDDQAGLLKSIEMYQEEKLPIRLLSDGPLKTFKEYRVYDDFEKQPLHGTFVIDAQGNILWQDISYEPFMDADFLLKEAPRLLKQNQVKPLAALSSKED